MKLNLFSYLIIVVFLVASCSKSDNNIKAIKTKNGIEFLDGAYKIGLIENFENDYIKVKEKVEEISPGIFQLKRILINNGTEIIKLDNISVDLKTYGKANWLMIPSITYNGNEWGRGNEPKGFLKDGKPWVYSALRTPIPGLTYIETEKHTVALYSDKNLKVGDLSCSIFPKEEFTVQSLLWPEEEKPLNYGDRDAFDDPVDEDIELKPGEEFSISAKIVISDVLEGHRSIRYVFDEYWSQIKTIPHPDKSPEELWNLGLIYSTESLWAEEGDYKGFSIGLTLYDGKWEQRRGWKYEIGWCGQNASLANSLLFDYLRNKNENYLNKAILCLDTWMNTVLPNGLIQTHYDYILGLSTGEQRLDACNLGTAALNYFEAFDLASDCGIVREEYQQLAYGICNFILEDQEESGRYGKAWNIEGECINREGTIGAFLIPPMLKAYELSRDIKYMESAQMAYDYYYKKFINLGYTSDGALDTYCIDKESAISLLRSAITLFKITGNKDYIKEAEDVSWYLSSWLWHYNPDWNYDTDFGKYNWSCFGGTSVSVQHHHLDPYALLWVPEWIELAEFSGDNQWKEKAQAIWFNGSQLVSDGTLIIHDMLRPAGSQNEAYYESRWKGGPGKLNDWLVAWPTAFRLETLRRVKWGDLKW